MKTGVSFLGKKFNNPIILASGTSGYGFELNEIFDISMVGAVVLKAVTLNEMIGNKPPRIAETASGMMNAIGLANRGIDYFEKNIIKKVENLGANIIANIAGNSISDYIEVCKRLNNYDVIDFFELNVSCPNVHANGKVFANDLESMKELIYECKNVSKKQIITKLPPDVFNIELLAKTAEVAGSDGLSLINTVPSMEIDIYNACPKISNNFAGLSGEAIRPIALRLVYLASKAVSIPIIGGGGVSALEDVIKFLMAGSSLVSIGTLTIKDPIKIKNIVEQLPDILAKLKKESISEIIGSLKLNE